MTRIREEEEVQHQRHEHPSWVQTEETAAEDSTQEDGLMRGRRLSYDVPLLVMMLTGHKL